MSYRLHRTFDRNRSYLVVNLQLCSAGSWETHVHRAACNCQTTLQIMTPNDYKPRSVVTNDGTSYIIGILTQQHCSMIQKNISTDLSARIAMHLFLYSQVINKLLARKINWKCVKNLNLQFSFRKRCMNFFGAIDPVLRFWIATE